MKLWQWTVIIVAVVIALIVIPLGIHGATSEFSGADSQAEGAIGEVDPDYKPWFTSIWEPPSGEIESLLFALQAAAGSALIFYAFGYIVGRKKGREQGLNDAAAEGAAGGGAGGPSGGRPDENVGGPAAAPAGRSTPT